MAQKELRETKQELVYVIDLTLEERNRLAQQVDQDGKAIEESPKTELAQPPERPIRYIALLTEAQEDPILLPIEPTKDVRYLDALARLLRIGDLAGETIPSVAINYGDVYERKLAFERKLPDWAYSGVDSELLAQLPASLKRVLKPQKNS